MNVTPEENKEELKELRNKQVDFAVENAHIISLVEGVRDGLSRIEGQVQGLREDLRDNYVTRREFMSIEKSVGDIAGRELKTKDKVIWTSAAAMVGGAVSYIVSKLST